jgi:hypothetical protein
MNKDIAKVILVTGTGLGITMAQINTGLTTVSLLLAISFTIYKWVKAYKGE